MLYVELDMLTKEGSASEWKEKVRWIKFEQDLEESQNWGKPHMGFLTYHSLTNLRVSIENGSIILNMQACTLEEIVEVSVNTLVTDGYCSADQKSLISDIMLLSRNHGHTRNSIPYIKSVNEQHGEKVYPVTATEFRYNFDETHFDDEHVRHLARDIHEWESAGVFVGVVNELYQPVCVFVRLEEPVLIPGYLCLPIRHRFFFLLIGPERKGFNYYEVGRAMSALFADPVFQNMAYDVNEKTEMLDIIDQFFESSLVLSPCALSLENPDVLKYVIMYHKERFLNKFISESQLDLPEEQQGFERTGHLFGGLIRDIERRYPKYKSDFIDGFNLQCLAAIIFIYFAALSPAITFGGLLGTKTNNLMGASESLLACCISGVFYGLFAGQPMLIIGATGPLLVFEEAIAEVCDAYGLDLLAFRCWIGVWIAVIGLILVMLEGSFLISYISKFTQEIFSILISFIFIYETLNKLGQTFQEHPLKSSYTKNGIKPNTALLTLVLCLGTFCIAVFLRMFKNSKFFTPTIRRVIGDFGVPIAILIMVLLDIYIGDTYTEKLKVPEGFTPTSPGRSGWYISPLGPAKNKMPVVAMFVAVVPAALVFILIFMESQITEMLVSTKEKKLKKGSGFHLDILIISWLNLVMSLLGMPMVCGATLRSITHANSLTIMQSSAPGEIPLAAGVYEQRVTTIVVSLMLGASVLMQPLLIHIPIAILFGVFLYMGVMSMIGVMLFERVKMLFMPRVNFPDFEFVRKVKKSRIHLYTFVQLVCLAILWAVKVTVIKIAFPFVLMFTIPLRRKLLCKIFTSHDLEQLD